MDLTLKDKAAIYRNWLSDLKAGDRVEVQHPWQDTEFYSGARSSAMVVRTQANGILVEVEPTQQGRTQTQLFSTTSGRSSYAQLAPVNIEVQHSWADNVGYYATMKPPRKRESLAAA